MTFGLEVSISYMTDITSNYINDIVEPLALNLLYLKKQFYDKNVKELYKPVVFAIRGICNAAMENEGGYSALFLTPIPRKFDSLYVKT